MRMDEAKLFRCLYVRDVRSKMYINPNNRFSAIAINTPEDIPNVAAIPGRALSQGNVMSQARPTGFLEKELGQASQLRSEHTSQHVNKFQ